MSYIDLNKDMFYFNDLLFSLNEFLYIKYLNHFDNHHFDHLFFFLFLTCCDLFSGFDCLFSSFNYVTI